MVNVDNYITVLTMTADVVLKDSTQLIFQPFLPTAEISRLWERREKAISYI